MFEAKQWGNVYWWVGEPIDPKRPFSKHRYLCKDGVIRPKACGDAGASAPWSEILADPTSAYYPTQAAALAAIHAHYHDDQTETIDDIPATLGEGE